MRERWPGRGGRGRAVAGANLRVSGCNVDMRSGIRIDRRNISCHRRNGRVPYISRGELRSACFQAWSGSGSCGFPQGAVHLTDSRVIRWKATHANLLSLTPKRRWDGTFTPSESPRSLRMLQRGSRDCNPDHHPREYKEQGDHNVMDSHALSPLPTLVQVLSRAT